MSEMTPREIVQELDKHIVGQDEAKRAVAIALRNRWRRQQVSEDLRNEITFYSFFLNFVFVSPNLPFRANRSGKSRKLSHSYSPDPDQNGN